MNKLLSTHSQNFLLHCEHFSDVSVVAGKLIQVPRQRHHTAIKKCPEKTKVCQDRNLLLFLGLLIVLLFIVRNLLALRWTRRRQIRGARLLSYFFFIRMVTFSILSLRDKKWVWKSLKLRAIHKKWREFYFNTT